MSEIQVDALPSSLTPDMASLLEALHGRCFAGVAGADWSASAFRTILGTSTARGWLSCAGSLPVGLILVRAAGDDCEILTFGVGPGSRRLGHGRALMCRAARWAGAQGLARIVLEVAETNQAARAFYDRCGFLPCGRRDAYYAVQGQRVDALVLAASSDGVMAAIC